MHVIRIDFGLVPKRIFEAIPGTMNFLQFLQKFEFISNGILILNFILIFFKRIIVIVFFSHLFIHLKNK